MWSKYEHMVTRRIFTFVYVQKKFNLLFFAMEFLVKKTAYGYSNFYGRIKKKISEK